MHLREHKGPGGWVGGCVAGGARLSVRPQVCVSHWQAALSGAWVQSHAVSTPPEPPPEAGSEGKGQGVISLLLLG